MLVESAALRLVIDDQHTMGRGTLPSDLVEVA